MTLKIKASAVLVAVALIVPESASEAPQRAPSEVGKVLETGGPLGAVIVVRGAQAYALQAGDLLFIGDRVITRTNGTAKLLAGDCERSLDPVASIVVDEDICDTAPVTLVSDDAVAAATVLGTAEIGIGATPNWLGLLASGTGAAAAIAGSAEVVD